MTIILKALAAALLALTLATSNPPPKSPCVLIEDGVCWVVRR